MKKLAHLIAVLITTYGANAQTPNMKTEQIRISGNCEMCKSGIEKSGSKKKEANVQWDSKSKWAIIRYDSLKQSTDNILKRIALAGYDNEKYLAPDDAYSKLPECCKYQRSLKNDNTMNAPGKNTPEDQGGERKRKISALEEFLSDYFDLKNAFIQSDVKVVSGNAQALFKQAELIDISDLTEEQHIVWMKVNMHMREACNAISKTDKLDEQRKKFSELSKDIYELVKVAHLNYEVYYQHCPMFNNGSDWLSKEPDIRNPFYGNQMLTCGKTVETIK